MDRGLHAASGGIGPAGLRLRPNGVQHASVGVDEEARQQAWKDKLAADFTNSGTQSGDKLLTLIQFAILAMQHGMIWVGLSLMPGNDTTKGGPEDLNRLGAWLGAMAQSNKDQGPEVVLPPADRRGKR